VQQAANLRTRQILARRLTGTLDRYLDIEEAYLYPALRKHVSGGVGLAAKASRDANEISAETNRLRSLPADDERLPAVLVRLRTEVVSHFRDEEERVFVRLRGACTREQLTELADRARVELPRR
jgi:hypothetical protein